MIPDLPDLQCAWALLLHCAVPRSNHYIRSLPPSQVHAYAAGHDRALQKVLRQMVGVSEDIADEEKERIANLSTLPMGLGGMGIRSATRLREAAYWASWADAIPMLKQRCPEAARELVSSLASSQLNSNDCLREVQNSRANLQQAGIALPSWQDIWDGIQPEQATNPEPGEWRHGWQYVASSELEKHFRRTQVEPSLSEDSMSLLRSQSGCCAGRHLTLIPKDAESTFTSERFRGLLQRRLRLPLQFVARRCNGRTCRCLLGERGDHRSACSRAGRLVIRSSPVERMWARVCREGGARVSTNAFLRDMNISNIDVRDGRRIEVLANGLSLYHGTQVAIDATIISPLKANGRAAHNSNRYDGAAIREAIKVKERTYPELVNNPRCKLLVAPVEIGGRWGEDAYNFLVAMAEAKVRASPIILRRALLNAYTRRWTGMISYAVQDAFAASILEDSPAYTMHTDGNEPHTGSLVANDASEAPGIPISDCIDVGELLTA